MKTHISYNKVFWSFLIIAFLTGSLALAAPVGKISAIQGRVDVLKAGKNVAAPVSLGAPVDIGDIYRTKTNSRAEITFINNNTMKIAPATRVEIKEYMVEKERSSTVMKLYRGKIQAEAHQNFVKRAAAFAEGNKFEVHTPNAVAGIRGSDMIVGFTNGTTMVVFISGQGYLYNPASPQVFTPIVAGQVSFITGEGTPSAPVKASEAIISGEVGSFIQIIETKKDTKQEDIIITPPPPPPDIPVLAGTNFTGEIFGGILDDSGGYVGSLGNPSKFTGNIPGSGVGTLSASGTLALDGTPTVLEGFLEGTSDKGGAFYGPLAGVHGSWLDRVVALYVEGGNVFFLTGDAPGTLADTAFSMSGTFGKSASQGTITLPGTGQALLEELWYAIEDGPSPQFFPSGSPSVISNSGIQINPSYFMYTAPYLITNQGKKVAAIGNIYTGSYLPAEGTSSLPYMGYTGDYEYALGPLFYSHDTTNKKFTVDMLLQSIGIDEEIGPYLGVYTMRYLGTYDAESFRMAGGGTYVATPANFFGDWGPIGSLYYNNNGTFGLAGEDYGYFGGLTSPWTSPASFTAIGTYGLDPSDKPHYLMNTYISGSTTQDVSSPAGTIEGFAGAILKDGNPEDVGTTVGSIGGALRAVYVSTPDASGYVTAGIMKSDISGSYYPFSTDSGMWGISGTLTPTPHATGLNPGDLSYGYGVMSSGGLSGTFSGAGSIYGVDNGFSETLFLYTSEQSLPFGVFNMRFGYGDYPNGFTGKPTGNPSWSATLGGYGEFDSTDFRWGFLLASTSGTWTDTGEITGNVTGKALTPLRMYDVEGRFSGVNGDAGEGSGTWIGQAIGSYTGTDLKFFSYFYGDMLDAVDSSGNIVFYPLSSMSGNFGGTTSLWSGSNIPVKIMGSVGSSCLWYTSSPIYSYNAYTGLNTTYDGGAYYGLAGGNEYAFKDIVSTKTLEGKFVALYIDNSATPKAGFLKASLSGDIYKDINMFEMDGLVNRTEKSTSIGIISASDLYGNVSQGTLDGTGAYLSGTFNNGAAITGGEDPGYLGATYAIATQPWGIYGLPLVGSFGSLETVPTTWSAKVGSTGTFGEYQDASPDAGYWLASITGTVPTGATTTEGKLFGTLAGKYLTHTRLGTMDGDVYGTYEDSGYWKAVALGTWTGTPLTSSLAFSTADATPTTLWRALPGTYYEADFTQWDASTNSYHDYEYRYIQTSGKGFGKVNDDMGPYPDKLYFPNSAMWKKDQERRIWMTGWDIASIDQVRNLPGWMHPSYDTTFTPTWYSEWPGFLDVLEKRSDDYLDAILGMTSYPWSTGGTPVTVIGKYTASDYTKPTIVTTPFLFSTFYTPYVAGGTANGAYGMTLGGFIADDARGVQMAIRGLFVGPDNATAGVLRGSQALTGSLYKDIGMWEAEGTVVANVMNSSFASNPEGVNIGNFSANIINGPFASQIMGRFTGDSGSLFATMENLGTTRFIKGQDWGVFSSTIWVGGFGVSSLSTTIPGTWSAQVGAEGQFGAYKDASNNWQADIGMMLIPTLSGTLTGGVAKASYTSTVGQFMTMTKMGTISDVGVLGVYTQPETVEANKLYSWQGVMGGVWNTTQYFTFASSFNASSKRFAEMHYGGYSDGSYNHYYYNYDNEVKYGEISFFSDASRTLITQRKYETDSGPFPTPMWYEYTYAKGTNTFSGYTTGTDYPASFSDAFFSDLAAAKGQPAPNQQSTWWNFSHNGSISAIMGGVGNLWTATAGSPATVYFLGDFNSWNGKPTIFGTDIVSYNVKNSTNTTLDGKGTYYGYIGGREIDGAIEGRIYTVYLDPAETSPAGILKGSFTGTVYSSDIELWAGQGGIYPVYLMDVSVPLGDFSSHLYTRDFYDENGTNTSFTLNGYQMGEEYSRSFTYQGEGTTFYATEGSWGVWQSAVGGKYTGITPTDSWTATIEFIDSTRIMGNGVTGTKWSGNKLEGTTVGYGADITPAQTYTWVSVGELKGTFNPTLLTFQAGVMGVSVETNTYLTLAATDPGKAKLQALGIPAVQVGMATLTGSGNGFSTLSMNDVKFFATSAGGKPSIWATNSVTGNYTAPPSTSTAISLSGGTLNASFNFKQWDTGAGKWLGSVNGTGGFNGSTTFKGAAAGLGATAGSGSIAGTAAGIAK